MRETCLLFYLFLNCNVKHVYIAYASQHARQPKLLQITRQPRAHVLFASARKTHRANVCNTLKTPRNNVLVNARLTREQQYHNNANNDSCSRNIQMISHK